MPTSNRREFIPAAVRSFLSQDWPDKELVVVDDGEPIRDLLDHVPNLTYSYLDKKLNIGDKRNLACKLSKGEVILNWDDDDWSAPGRITNQVEALNASGKSVTGYYSIAFYDMLKSVAYRFTAGNPKRYVMGTSQCYRKDWWAAHPYPSKEVGEDSEFLLPALRGIDKQLDTADGCQMIVARIHGAHTSPKNPERQREYVPIEVNQLPSGFPFAL